MGLLPDTKITAFVSKVIMTSTSRILPPIWVLALAVSSSNLGLALLSPAIPSLRADFTTSADNAQLVLSGFLVAVGVGQLVAGTLSDRYGRRSILVIGAFIFAIAGFVALFAEAIWWLVLCRVVQGFGAAACMAMGRVIISDSFARNEAGRQMSTITMVQAVVPALGFAFGGIIAEYVGWQGSLLIMAVGASLTFIAAFLFIRESNPDPQDQLNFAVVMAAYGGLARNKLFGMNTINSSLVVAMFMSMGGFMPYQFERYGLDALDFGIFFSFTSVGYLVGNSLNRRYGTRFGIDRASLFGATVTVAVMVGMLASHLIGVDSEYSTTVFCFLFGVGNGFTVANAIVGAVRAAGKDSGSAMGLVGCIQMLASALFGSLVIAVGGDESFVIALIMLNLMAVVAWLGGYFALEKDAGAAD